MDVLGLGQKMYKMTLYVHSSTIYNGTKLETTHRLWKIEWTIQLWFTPTMEHYTIRRNEQTIASFNNVDESHKHNVEPKKPDTVEAVLYDSAI